MKIIFEKAVMYLKAREKYLKERVDEKERDIKNSERYKSDYLNELLSINKTIEELQGR